MKMTKLFSKTRKTHPSDEVALNAQLLIKAGYIHKEMAGVYSYLPLGLKVIENIKNIVREEMNALDSQELTMTTLQEKELWEKTDRWNDENVDIWFKSELKNGTEVGFGWSHEEQVGNMVKEYINSYRDLPMSVYQFQNKLRNETRAKSGILRTREFIMKDMYSFAESEEQHKEFYDRVTEAYHKIFKRVGLGNDTYFTFASGGAFTDKFSHEFQTLVGAGEDIVYINKDKKVALNKEVFNDDVLDLLGLEKKDFEEAVAAEVGNIFSFGSTKSEALGIYFTDKEGTNRPVIMGSYGIGIARLMGVIVEYYADENGLNWPYAVAPYKVLISTIGNQPEVIKEAEKVYKSLTANGIEVLYDDRDMRPGEKFADADLLGIPLRVVISEKNIKNGELEIKKRSEKTSHYIKMDELDKVIEIMQNDNT
jgi:prolyl-tRNA synthetase